MVALDGEIHNAPELARERGGLFRPEYVSRLVAEHLEGRKDNRKPLWTLICFELWRENFL